MRIKRLKITSITRQAGRLKVFGRYCFARALVANRVEIARIPALRVVADR